MSEYSCYEAIKDKLTHKQRRIIERTIRNNQIHKITNGVIKEEII